MRDINKKTPFKHNPLCDHEPVEEGYIQICGHCKVEGWYEVVGDEFYFSGTPGVCYACATDEWYQEELRDELCYKCSMKRN